MRVNEHPAKRGERQWVIRAEHSTERMNRLRRWLFGEAESCSVLRNVNVTAESWSFPSVGETREGVRVFEEEVYENVISLTVVMCAWNGDDCRHTQTREYRIYDIALSGYDNHGRTT